MLMGCFYNTPNIILCILYNIRCTSLVYWDNYINYRRGFLFVVLALYQRCTLKDDISYLLPT